MPSGKAANAETAEYRSLRRLSPDYIQGLTGAQVQERMDCGAHNEAPENLTRSVKKIVWDNVFTLFNILNLAIACVIVAVGHYKNILFLGVAVSNTLLGIFQEVRAKLTIDKLSIVTRTKATVIRDGEQRRIALEEIVLDDIMYVSAGSQICSDGVVVFSEGLEADESLLTGEADSVKKPAGAEVMSGSFVTAGGAYIRVTAVGGNNYAAKLTREAKREKKPKSELMRSLGNIIKVLTIVIIPLGAILFTSQYTKGVVLDTAVLGTAAAMIGMIPEGLMLLTGVAFAVGAVSLSRHKTLVQSMPCIETLARVDVLCLDKTGTITDGSLKVTETICLDDTPMKEVEIWIARVIGATNDDNPTAKALKTRFGADKKTLPAVSVPFSSKRKWSGASFRGGGSYIIGAPEFILRHMDEPLKRKINEYSGKGFRVICLAHSAGILEGEMLPHSTKCLALIMISDNIRAEAPATFAFFAEQGVTLKVISGDNPVTVSNIARRAGLESADRYIDMSSVKEGTELTRIAEEHTVFGRVTPYQKRELVRALQKAGHTACMTGDGVNDVLALKEADCSVSMAGGSDAARTVSDFVLLTSNFDAMINVLKEGRRVVNNIERVASLYLVKTIYSAILSLIFIFLPLPYPFAPLQMMPISALTVGIPSFFLALRPSYQRISGRFMRNVLKLSLPAAITVVCNILVIQLAGVMFGLTSLETSTMNVFLTGTVGFVMLHRIARPLNRGRALMLCLLGAAFVSAFLFFGDFFTLGPLITRNVFFYLPLMLSSYTVFSALSNASDSIHKYMKKRARSHKSLRT